MECVPITSQYSVTWYLKYVINAKIQISVWVVIAFIVHVWNTELILIRVPRHFVCWVILNCNHSNLHWFVHLYDKNHCLARKYYHWKCWPDGNLATAEWYCSLVWPALFLTEGKGLGHGHRAVSRPTPWNVYQSHHSIQSQYLKYVISVKIQNFSLSREWTASASQTSKLGIIALPGNRNWWVWHKMDTSRPFRGHISPVPQVGQI